MRRLVAAALLICVAGCGTEEQSISDACTADGATIDRALARAPGAVRLDDGTRLSQCLADADTDAELQSFGVVITRLGDDLADRGDALRLGYLVGAARRGAAKTNGIGLELSHRLEVSARRLAPERQAAYGQGLRAGERSG